MTQGWSLNFLLLTGMLWSVPAPAIASGRTIIEQAADAGLKTLDALPTDDMRPGAVIVVASMLVEAKRCRQALALLIKNPDVLGGLTLKVVHASTRTGDQVCRADLARLTITRADDPAFDPVGRASLRYRAAAHLRAAGMDEEGRAGLAAATPVLTRKYTVNGEPWYAWVQEAGLYRGTNHYRPTLIRHARAALAQPIQKISTSSVNSLLMMLVDAQENALAAELKGKTSYDDKSPAELVDLSRRFFKDMDQCAGLTESYAMNEGANWRGTAGLRRALATEKPWDRLVALSSVATFAAMESACEPKPVSRPDRAEGL